MKSGQTSQIISNLSTLQDVKTPRTSIPEQIPRSVLSFAQGLIFAKLYGMTEQIRQSKLLTKRHKEQVHGIPIQSDASRTQMAAAVGKK
ncbi:MAG: hypothetical protein R6X08_01420 [Desulfosalsimonadaceae bacterium]